MKKVCKKCGIEKELEEFHVNKGCKDGRRGTCKQCELKKKKEYYKKNRKRELEYSKKYREEHIEKVKEYQKKWQKEHKIEQSIKSKERSKNHYKQNKNDYYIRVHNRNAMKQSLRNDLTTNEWNDILNDFGNKCILTNKSKDISLEHFIPLSIGHGGTFVGNVYPMSLSLNISKGNKNPFKWIKSQDGKIQHVFYNVLVPYLAEQNNMDTKTFKMFVNWCFNNKRTLEQVKEDNAKGLDSIDLFYMSFENVVDDAN